MADKEAVSIPIKAQVLSQMGYVLMNEIPEHEWPIGEPERIAGLCFDVDVDGYHLKIVRVPRLITVARSLICWLDIHKFTPWEHDPVAPVGFGSYRRRCLWCGRREAKG